MKSSLKRWLEAGLPSGGDGRVAKGEGILCYAGGETLAEVAQRGGRCPIPGNIPGQTGRGSEKPDVVEDVPAHGRGVGLGHLQRSLPTQTVL